MARNLKHASLLIPSTGITIRITIYASQCEVSVTYPQSFSEEDKDLSLRIEKAKKESYFEPSYWGEDWGEPEF